MCEHATWSPLGRIRPRGSGGMADAHGSGPCARKGVRVQLPPSPQVRGRRVSAESADRAPSQYPARLAPRGRELRHPHPQRTGAAPAAVRRRPPRGRGLRHTHPPANGRCPGCGPPALAGLRRRLTGYAAELSWIRGIEEAVRVSVAVVTGSAGLIGSEAVRHFAALGLDVVGIDNDMRARFFGPEASTAWNVLRLTTELSDSYTHHDVDIRDRDALAGIFRKYGREIAVVIHTAAQPSHDWAVRDPYTDFDINAVGTLNVLQNVREYCIDAPVIHCSTNKVYGDRPNSLPFRELETRWEIDPSHPYADGIREDMSIDSCLH